VRCTCGHQFWYLHSPALVLSTSLRTCLCNN
jgi:hypothetical protein